ncbi:MAG: DUF4230 domain-containing protein [Chloroherpetonaceae bacterium]|nr:DUF4230 domain-containing protein [Chloroherpetonaceae bacterium]MDW8437194.1 DUF4230 domain-containing protein [Chloroherpetonaceae bacterium]
MTFTTRLSLLFLAIALAAFSVYYFLFKLPIERSERAFEKSKEAARKIASEFQQAFGFSPEILARDCVIVGAATPILELATVSKPLTVETSYGEKDAMTSYSVVVRGEYVVKAGYDLRKKFRIEVAEGGISAEFPEPQILSAELTNYEILGEGGTLSVFWKKTSKQAVQEAALKRNKERALQAADSSGILNDAREKLLLQTRSIFERVSESPKNLSIRFRG